MGDPKRLEQISKILDFVTGKGVPNGMRGYDQRMSCLSTCFLVADEMDLLLVFSWNFDLIFCSVGLSSWLLMASDLIPFLPNTYNKQGSVQQPPQPNVFLLIAYLHSSLIIGHEWSSTNANE